MYPTPVPGELHRCSYQVIYTRTCSVVQAVEQDVKGGSGHQFVSDS